MTAASILAVCRVHQLLKDSGDVGVTAIDKRPVDGPVKVRKLGLRADIQANRKHHGGEDQAVYVYAQEEAEVWARELGRDIPAGLFGENLRTEGIGTTDAVVGEQWLIGGSVLAEVTSPRVPCATFQRRMGEPQWVKRFTERGLVGAYLRVLKTGTIAAGNSIEVVSRPTHGVTVGDWFRNSSPEDGRKLLAADAEGQFSLSAEMRAKISSALKAAASV